MGAAGVAVGAAGVALGGAGVAVGLFGFEQAVKSIAHIAIINANFVSRIFFISFIFSPCFKQKLVSQG